MVELLLWYNLPFVLPFVAALGYILLLASGAVSAGHGGEAEVDVGHDVDVGDADADMDHDLGVEHDSDVGHDHDHDAGEQSSFGKVLGLLGVGKTPTSIVYISWCLIWGFVGYAANVLLAPVLRFPGVFFWGSVAAALFASIMLTGALARIIGRLMPSTETYVTQTQELVGCSGVAELAINETFGRAQVYDRFRNLHAVPCVVRPGQDPIAKDAEVVLTGYDRSGGRFYASLAKKAGAGLGR